MALDIEINIEDKSIIELKKLLDNLKDSVEGVGDDKELLKYTKSIDKVSKKIKELTGDVEDFADATDDVNTSLEETNKVTNRLDQTFEDTFGDTATLSSKLGDLEDQLYALALAGDTSSDEFILLQNEAGKLRQTMIKVDESVDDIAGNRGLSTFGTQLGGVAQSLLTLDFERASKQSSMLAKTAQTISFKKAAGSVKKLGKTFLNLGKSLLKNPFFILAAVVVILVVVIVKFLKKIGVLTVIMKALGKVFQVVMDIIDAMIQPFKDFTDWLGITDNAAKKSAEEQAEASKKKAEASIIATKAIVQGLDNEIKMAELQGKSTEELQKKRIIQLAENAKLQAQADKAAFISAKFNDDLTKQEKLDIKATARDSRLAHQQSLADIKIFNVQKEKEQVDFANREKLAAARLGADNLEGQIKLLKQQRAIALQQTGKTESEIAEIKAKFREDEAALVDADRKARIAKWKSWRSDRTNALRKAEDIDLAIMDEGFDKQIRANKIRFDRLIEDVKNDEKLKAEEKANISKLLEEQRVKQEAKIKKTNDDKILAEEEKFNKALADLTKEAEQTQLESLETEYLANKEKLMKEFTDEVKQKELLLALEKKFDSDKLVLEEEFKARDEAARLELEATDFEGKLAKLESDRNLELEQLELTENEKLLILQKFDDDKKALEDEEKERAQNLAFAKASIVADGLNIIASIAEQNAGEDETRQKKAFQLRKLASLAQAGIDGTKAVLSAYADTPGGPVIKGIAATIAGGFAAIQFGKIASAEFEGAERPSAEGASVTPSLSTGSSVTGATPNFSFFGSGSEANNLSSEDSVEDNQNININSTISVTEITETQNNVANIEESRTL